MEGMNNNTRNSTSDSSSDYSSSCSDNNNTTNKLSERIKGPWSAEEDRILTRLVEKYGPRNWSLISRYIKGRSGKSCRLRWCNQLSPNVEHRPFSSAEDDAILAAHAKYGNRWATIARLLPGRTDNAVKNHWNSTLKRRQRGDNQVRREPPQQEMARVDQSQDSRAWGLRLGGYEGDVAENGVVWNGGGAGAAAAEVEDPFTALTLAPPGTAAAESGRCASAPTSGFWDAMRGVIAREVREYVTTSFEADENSGFQ